MRVRMLDKNNDMTFGNGNLNFYRDKTEGVAQNVYTRLKLFLGEWFFNEEEGTDWFGKCLGKNTTESALNEIRRVVAQTDGVLSVEDLTITNDEVRRHVIVQGNITTRYGSTTINYNGSFFIGEKE